jgi:hypothetical protein
MSMRRGTATSIRKSSTASAGSELQDGFSHFIPREVGQLGNPQTAIPRIAKNNNLVDLIEAAVKRIPTSHKVYLGDARLSSSLWPESVHLVLTSPPYWTLKRYRDVPGQMGHIGDYELFLLELYQEPSPELSFQHFVASLLGRANAN